MTNDAELTSYDSIDIGTYFKHIERPDSWNNLYERPYLISKLPDLKGKNILDIGCSSGYYTEYALKAGAKVTAIDISQKMTGLLASRIKSANLNIYCADISQSMPFFTAESYDIIICSLVLHYIKDWNPLLAEFHRVIKASGRVFITTHHPLAMFLYLQSNNYYDFKLIEDTWGDSENRFKVHYYIRPLTEVLRPLIESNFRIESIEEMLPPESLKESHPELYQRLIERPGFLFIEMVKEAG
jgi:SAM-dependent methyltransferase